MGIHSCRVVASNSDNKIATVFLRRIIFMTWTAHSTLVATNEQMTLIEFVTNSIKGHLREGVLSVIVSNVKPLTLSEGMKVGNA